jgi:glycosyltransferase involved in cell wall biosynthesis
MALIAVDMTPLLPGGENGGAKLVAMELLKGIREADREHNFLILTAFWNDKELSVLDRKNMKRLCVVDKAEQDKKQWQLSFRGRIPLRIERRLRKIYWFFRRYYRSNLYKGGPLTTHGVDLLFCPFTAIPYAEPGIPIVSLIHDLQHKDYPQFFSQKEIDARNTFMDEVCRRADAIICVSESTRIAVIKNLKTDPDKTHTVHNCIHSRLLKPGQTRIDENLEKLNIANRSYMFYPANFWLHKNHNMLLTAYGMYISRNPDCKIDLVLTGALDDAQQDLKDKVRRMGLERYVHFLGYLPDDQLTTVWKGCSFLIFPTLYEGFGIPVIEAMQFGKPVLCSNVTSLPEVAGSAALYFDPRKPLEIVQCIEQITRDKDLYDNLVRQGYKRLSHFQRTDMVNKYLKHFDDYLHSSQQMKDEISGIYPDNWIGNTFQIMHSGGHKDCVLELRLEVPGWFPFKKATIRLAYSADKNSGQKWIIRRGMKQEIKLSLPESENQMLFSIDPVFIPSEYNIGPDSRTLGILCRGCYLISPDGEQTLLWPDKIQ